MAFHRSLVLAAVVLLSCCVSSGGTMIHAFTPTTTYYHNTPTLARHHQGNKKELSRGSSTTLSSTMSTVIEPESADFTFDQGLGGVRLAEESVLQMIGTVKHKPGKATPDMTDFIRYTQLRTIGNVDDVHKILDPIGGQLICTGLGQEEYIDPGETTEAVVTNAPHDAVIDALQGAGSAMEFSTIIINVAGGSDAQILEVLNAIKDMVLDLDIATKAKIYFHSLSHDTFATGTSTMTVVGLPEGFGAEGAAVTAEWKGAEKSIAQGQVYLSNDGQQYYTVTEDDINTDVA